MVDAFGERAKGVLPVCRGRHPHLRDASGDCGRELRTILLGSSSSWFPQAISALSIPTGQTELEQAVEDVWAILENVEAVHEVATFRRANLLKGATKFSDDEIFGAISARKSGEVGAVDTEDMKQPEWAVLSDPRRRLAVRTSSSRKGRRRTVSIPGSTPRSSWSGVVK